MTAPDDSSFAAILLQLTNFSARLAALEAKRAPSGGDDDVYVPEPSIHWWSADAEERTRAIEHLNGWVEQVYQPYYGHLAVMLGDCWQQHDLCLVQLDWLSELHGYLYFSERTQAILAAQAEYGTRILPAVSEQFRIETSKCDHGRKPGGGGTWRSTA